ncbi:MAG: MFS transporter [Rhodobacteraceae bacterium]|nr:MFS transporter [Paracoccaceae bacterium]
MIRALKENWALFVGMLMLMAANGLLATLLSVRGSEVGFSETVIGIMQAGYPLGALIGSVVAPKMVQRVGHVRAFGALASMCSISAIVHLVTNDAISWSLMRLLAGFCFPGLYVVSESWLNAKAENHMRATLLSIYFVVQIFGAALGQAMTGLNDPSGNLLFGITSILISLSLVPLLISTNPAPKYIAPERLALSQLVRVSPMAIFGVALNGTMQAMFYVAMPLYGLALGMSVGQAALLLVTGTLAGAIAQFPIGWLSDRTDRRLVVLGLSVITVSTVLLQLGGAFGRVHHISVALLAASMLPVYSLCVAHANDQLTPSQIVPASGTLVLVLNVGVLAGAFGGPFVLGWAGPDSYLAIYGVLAGLTAALAMIRRAQEDAPKDTRSAPALAMQSTQTAAMLHPQARDSEETPISQD